MQLNYSTAGFDGTLNARRTNPQKRRPLVRTHHNVERLFQRGYRAKFITCAAAAGFVLCQDFAVKQIADVPQRGVLGTLCQLSLALNGFRIS